MKKLTPEDILALNNEARVINQMARQEKERREAFIQRRKEQRQKFDAIKEHLYGVLREYYEQNDVPGEERGMFTMDGQLYAVEINSVGPDHATSFIPINPVDINTLIGEHDDTTQ